MLGTQQSQIVGGTSKSMNIPKGKTTSEIVETRFMKPPRGGRIKRMATGGKPRSSVRGGNSGMQGRTTRSGLQQRETRSEPAAHVQQRREIPAQPRIPPRTPSQRILMKKLSGPLTGPGSSPDNEIVLD